MMMILNGKKIFTLLLVLDEKNERVLLGKKRRGFGVGLFNGFGGKVEEEDHSVYESALRELEEEATIKALDCIEVGRITFDWIDEEDKCPWLVHVFRVTKFSGIPEMTEEMIPEWFSYDEIPFDRMWEDDIHWYPHVLRNERFEGTFNFKEVTRLVDFSLMEVDSLTMT